MPTLRYPLESGGADRLRVMWSLSWSGRWKDIQVFLDDTLIGTIPTHRELAAGPTLFLPDHSILSLQLLGTTPFAGLRILVDGQPLPGSATEEVIGGRPGQAVHAATSVLFLVAALDVVLGLAALGFNVEFLLSIGIGLPSIGFGLLLAALGLLTKRGFVGGLWVALGVMILEAGLNVWLVYRLGLGLEDTFYMGLARLPFLGIVASGLEGVQALQRQMPKRIG